MATMTFDRIPARRVSSSPAHRINAAQAPMRLTRRGRIVVSGLVFAVISALIGAAVWFGLAAAGSVVHAQQQHASAPLVTTTVVIKAGQSLWSIAERFDPTRDPRAVIDEIASLNGLDANVPLQPGMTIRVPLHS